MDVYRTISLTTWILLSFMSVENLKLISDQFHFLYSIYT